MFCMFDKIFRNHYLMKKIFISYTNAIPDSAIALDFYHFFKNSGLDPFMSDKSIEMGEIWSHRIMTELSSCDYFLILLSANSIMSDMVTEELRRAKDLFNKRSKPIILPVRLKLGYDEVFNYEISGYCALRSDCLSPRHSLLHAPSRKRRPAARLVDLPRRTFAQAALGGTAK